jgi:hypothetical protein
MNRLLFSHLFSLQSIPFSFKEYGRKSFGIPYSVFAGITTSLITIAVALQFQAHLITSVWAIEATLLLLSGKRQVIRFSKLFLYAFPSGMIAQAVTWTEYFDTEKLSVIFNPVFLTSLVTIATTIINLYLLKNSGQKKQRKRQTAFLKTSLQWSAMGLYTPLSCLRSLTISPICLGQPSPT